MVDSYPLCLESREHTLDVCLGLQQVPACERGRQAPLVQHCVARVRPRELLKHIIKFSLPNEITPLPTKMLSLTTFSIFAQTPSFFAQTPLIFAKPSTFARSPGPGSSVDQ